MSDDDEPATDYGRPFNTYRDGKIHLLSEKCPSCIFNPHTRPVDGARVADLVRNTMDEEGATVVCHCTLGNEPQENAICRGWYDRFADRDNVLQLAKAMNVIEEVPPPDEEEVK